MMDHEVRRTYWHFLVYKLFLCLDGRTTTYEILGQQREGSVLGIGTLSLVCPYINRERYD